MLLQPVPLASPSVLSTALGLVWCSVSRACYSVCLLCLLASCPTSQQTAWWAHPSFLTHCLFSAVRPASHSELGWLPWHNTQATFCRVPAACPPPCSVCSASEVPVTSISLWLAFSWLAVAPPTPALPWQPAGVLPTSGLLAGALLLFHPRPLGGALTSE